MILTCTFIGESNSVFVVHLQGENSCLSLDSTIGGQNRPTIVQCQQYKFLQYSSAFSNLSESADSSNDSRRINLMCCLSSSESNKARGPTITSAWFSMQCVAKLQVFLPFLIWLLWFAHRILILSVFPIYRRPQEQDTQ